MEELKEKEHVSLDELKARHVSIYHTPWHPVPYATLPCTIHQVTL